MTRPGAIRHALIAFTVLATATGAAAKIPYEQFQLSDRQSDALISDTFRFCIDRSGGVTANMRDCSGAEFQRLDARLNAVYRAAMTRLPSEADRRQLRALERRWLTSRWIECDRDEREIGGTLGLVAWDGCTLSEMSRRIVWLEQYGRR